MFRLASNSLAFGLAISLAACGDRQPPTTSHDPSTARPAVNEMKMRCYDASRSKRDRTPVTLEFEVRVDRRGEVTSEVLSSDADDPGLVDCMQRGFRSFKYPAGQPSTARVKFMLDPPGDVPSGVLRP